MMIKRTFTIVNVLLVAAGVYFGVKAFYTLATARLAYGPAPGPTRALSTAPANAKPPPRAHYNAIVARNIFHTGQASAPIAKRVDLQNLKQTNLKLKLWGTVTGRNGRTYAVIEDTKSRRQELYRVGDSVQDATVKMVLRQKVVLRVDGRDEILAMQEKTTGRSGIRRQSTRPAAVKLPVSSYPHKIILSRARLENSLDNPGQLMQQASIRPHIENGKPAGIAITGIKPNAVFRRMRLRNGDIIVGVNGNSIETVDDAISVFEDLGSASDLKLEIKRRGRRRTLDYHIE